MPVLIFSGLDLDKTSGRIYWTDAGVRAITCSFINGSDVEKVVEVGLLTPQGIDQHFIMRLEEKKFCNLQVCRL